jgi:hypothetical protein
VGIADQRLKVAFRFRRTSSARGSLRLTLRDVRRSNAAGNEFGPLKFDAYCLRTQSAAGEKMSRPNELQIDSVHCRAICDEVGERLRVILRTETGNLPVRLQILLDRLADQDRELAPSIVPDPDDMIWRPVTVSHAG